jgi:hypothetical protein
MKDRTVEVQFGLSSWDWISEEPIGPRLKLLCWGCGESAVLEKVGNSFAGYIAFFEEHRECVKVKKGA